ncbi:hypothetical protein OPT61_g2526 [Boeremia exigua]|uniref:Uncharacterized protein n=1 Tax=Boeremia exigua TaxID=749465 RepID=A0ACC2ILF4_9PLEO|nr:hypothetical protein OPT61_g2526 [Boeremia exigua]
MTPSQHVCQAHDAADRKIDAAQEQELSGPTAIGSIRVAACVYPVMQPCGVPKCHDLSQVRSEQPQLTPSA